MAVTDDKLSEKIIGCAYAVYNEIGYGFLESVYETCMMIELAKAGLKAESQEKIIAFYKKQVVGSFVADIVVEDEIILELKSVRSLSQSHEVQLVNYLTASGKDLGLLINFGERSVEVKRKVKTLSQKSC